MSPFTRALLALSLLTATAHADRIAAPHFAQPPPHAIRPSEDILVVANRDAVRAALVTVRAQNVAAFRAYQTAGVFPSNTFQDRSLNVWRDRDGHYCAAATIIRQSGRDALVTQVAEQSNFIRLGDVKQGPLMDWILTSGFTQDEIAAIQEPFMPVYRERPVVKPDLRSAENRRLMQKYRTVTTMLVRDADRSLDAATDRLMKNRALAQQLVNANRTDD